MNEILDRVFDELRSAARFRWFGLAAAATVAIAGWLYVFALPDNYDATTSVFVNTETALTPVLEGLIVKDDVISQLGYVRQSILSGQTLEKIALESGVLAPAGVDARQRTDILSRLSNQVVIEAEGASADAYESSGTVYSIIYSSRDPKLAVKVTQTVLDTFIRETLGGKQETSEATQKFLAEQIKVYEERLLQTESRIAEFKKLNLGLLPTDRGDYFSQLQSELEGARRMEGDLEVAITRRSELARQLRGESVISAPTIAATTGGGADLASRIRDQEAKLDDLLLRYTDRHPDVAEARNALAELKARREAELESLRRGDAGAAAASGLSNNPIFQSIQLQLNQADVEIASLRSKLAQHNAKAAELRKLLDTAPKVEAEYAQLIRDYEINKTQREALLANYEKARLGEQADNAGGVRFQVVQAPVARLSSTSAHRDLLLVAVLGAALLAGAGLAYLLHLLRPVVVSLRDLGELTDLPVLGVVSPAFPRKLRSEARWAASRFCAVASLLLFLFAAVLALNWKGFKLASFLGGTG